MQLRRSLLSIKYWLRLSMSYNISPILWECFSTHQKFNSAWLKHIQRILNHCGLSYVHDEVSNLDPAGIILEVKERLNDQYIQKWREDLAKSNKMRTYRIFKSVFQMEKYLYLPLHLRTAIAKFRLSCHSLYSYRDRAVCKTYITERVCQTCNVMEDEKHFLLVCPRTQSLPEYVSLQNICEQVIRNFNSLSIDNKFSSMMSCQEPNLIYHLARLIYVALKYRDILR